VESDTVCAVIATVYHSADSMNILAFMLFCV
jgi:hypothetical protein